MIPADRPPFAEPWQAQVFALTVQLTERGTFRWPEFVAALGRCIAAAGSEHSPRSDRAPDTDQAASDYYACWTAALIDLLTEGGQLTTDDLAATEQAWHAAAARTPHGQPITLTAEPPEAHLFP